MSQLRDRRRLSRRRRRLARLDVGIGLCGALALTLLAPGLAISASIALLVLVLCAVSVIVERRVARREEARHAARGSRPSRLARR